MHERVISKSASGWCLQIAEPLPALAGQEESALLAEYLDEIRYPYQKACGEFRFPTALTERSILEVVRYFYDGIARVVVKPSSFTI